VVCGEKKKDAGCMIQDAGLKKWIPDKDFGNDIQGKARFQLKASGNDRKKKRDPEYFGLLYELAEYSYII
jgi:hypothetical protein